MRRHKVLLLAGTAEARILDSILGRLAEFEATVSLAGVTLTHLEYNAPLRVGGFGGAPALEDWLRAQGTAAVIDATHPFAARMQWNAYRACTSAGVPRLRVLRPKWPVRPEWAVVPDLAAAADALPPGARVFLTTGRELRPFLPRTDCRFLVRTIDPVSLPAHMEPIQGPPPILKADELRLIRGFEPTHLVSKNSGGRTTKLDIARALGIAVVMVARPPAPPGPIVKSPFEALDWLRATLDSPRGLAER